MKTIRCACALTVAGVLSAGVSYGESLNVATVRATVTSSESDCPSCSPLANHGCYVILAAPDQLVVGTPSGSMSCDAIPSGSCFEATGEITNDAVAEGFGFDHIQLAAHLWAVLPSDYCGYE